MNLFRILTPIRSAPRARERLHILLDYERRLINQTDLIAILREEIFAVVGRHVTFDPKKVQVREVHGTAFSNVLVDIEISNRAGAIATVSPARRRTGLRTSRNAIIAFGVSIDEAPESLVALTLCRHRRRPCRIGRGYQDAGATSQALESVKRNTLRKIASLEQQLRAGEGPEKRPLALAKGVQKLKRAAYHALKARAPAYRPLAADLLRISANIELHGLDAQLAGELGPMVVAAVAVEAETGEPVAQRIATAVDWFSKPHASNRFRRSEE
jgi:cell division topological specificity factor